MNMLNCDICGTSFPDTEEKCPTCGYSRAFLEEMMNQPSEHAAHVRVRGGRYSRKNVQKRQKADQPQTGTEDPGQQSQAPADKGVDRAARRRKRWLNFLLFIAIVVFLASAAYLALRYGLIDVQALPDWIPAQITEFLAAVADSGGIPVHDGALTFHGAAGL